MKCEKYMILLFSSKQRNEKFKPPGGPMPGGMNGGGMNGGGIGGGGKPDGGGPMFGGPPGGPIPIGPIGCTVKLKQDIHHSSILKSLKIEQQSHKKLKYVIK